MDDLGQRHQLARGVGPVGQVGHRPLRHLRRYPRVDRLRGHEPPVHVGGRVERRDVDALELGQRPPQRAAVPLHRGRPLQPGGHHLVDLAHGLLPVTEHEGVDEIGQWFGVVRAMAARHDEGVVSGPLYRMQWKAGQVDQVHEVGVDELGRQVEGQHVEGRRGQVLLHAEEGHTGGAHGRLHVDPGCVGAFRHRVGPLVEDLVEDLEALVGQADLVGVGVEQEPRHLARAVLGVHRALLAADVAGRLGHRGQEALDRRPEGLHGPQPYGTLIPRPSSCSSSCWRPSPSCPRPAGSSSWWWSASRTACWSLARSGWAGWPASAS